jgi:hypothetical protein
MVVRSKGNLNHFWLYAVRTIPVGTGILYRRDCHMGTILTVPKLRLASEVWFSDAIEYPYALPPCL